MQLLECCWRARRNRRLESSHKSFRQAIGARVPGGGEDRLASHRFEPGLKHFSREVGTVVGDDDLRYTFLREEFAECKLCEIRRRVCCEEYIGVFRVRIFHDQCVMTSKEGAAVVTMEALHCCESHGPGLPLRMLSLLLLAWLAASQENVNIVVDSWPPT